MKGLKGEEKSFMLDVTYKKMIFKCFKEREMWRAMGYKNNLNSILNSYVQGTFVQAEQQDVAVTEACETLAESFT